MAFLSTKQSVNFTLISRLNKDLSKITFVKNLSLRTKEKKKETITHLSLVAFIFHIYIIRQHNHKSQEK